MKSVRKKDSTMLDVCLCLWFQPNHLCLHYLLYDASRINKEREKEEQKKNRSEMEAVLFYFWKSSRFGVIHNNNMSHVAHEACGVDVFLCFNPQSNQCASVATIIKQRCSKY